MPRASVREAAATLAAMARARLSRVGVVAVAAVVSLTCIALGIWQLRRLHDRRTTNEAIRERTSAAPLEIVEPSAPDAAPFRAAFADGVYDVPNEVLVFGRSLDGRPGHLLVTPLRLAGTGAVLVVRGWVPFRFQSAPVEQAAPPLGDLRVRGWLAPNEEGSDPTDASRVVRSVDVDAIASELPYPVFPLPLQLSAQSPPQRGSLPEPVPLPPLSEGPHLSYAIQWFSFATISVVGGVILVR